MKSQKWFAAFSHKLTYFESEYNQSHSGYSPLGYALSAGKIQSQEYMKWAQNFFKLPYVKDDYFKSQLPPTANWKDWKSEYKWSPEIVPLSIWDGHLLVACLEIPLSFPNSLRPVFVLADLPNIEKTYQFYINSEKGANQAREKIKDISAPPIKILKKDLQTVEPEKIDLSEGFELLESSDSDENNLILNTEAEESPEGLDLSPSIPSINSIPTIPSMPNSLNATSIPKAPNAPISPTSFVHKELGTSVTTIATDSSLTRNVVLPSQIQDDLKKGMPYLASLKKQNTHDFETYSQDIFNKGKSVYDKMILFAIDPSESFTIPVSWTDTINPRNKNIDGILLSEPSVFKIVTSTIKSYHGYVVLNELNEKFFDFWNLGQVPGNITLCPIIINNKLIGFLMGLGETNSYNWSTLKKMESLTNEMTHFYNKKSKEPKAS
ncbi:MAG: hypothetical protein J0M15_13205 [Deltaproteobacteria bacterium]|jgi:hypothetical protein|nr:hypothetical protein [Deltaproteobacteria bacterium]